MILQRSQHEIKRRVPILQYVILLLIRRGYTYISISYSLWIIHKEMILNFLVYTYRDIL